MSSSEQSRLQKHPLSIMLLFSVLPAVLLLISLLALDEESFALIILAAVLLAVTSALSGINIVPPSERRVLVSLWSGEVKLLGSGFHWHKPLLRNFPVSKSNWKKFKRFPELGCRLHLDPSPTQVHTKDRIPAVADVSLECVVREWSAASAVKDGGCIHTRACTTVNQWLSEQLSQLLADEYTYGHLNHFLNAPERVDALNTMLVSNFTYLSAQRIVIDPNGIQLDQKWVTQRDEINQKRQLLNEREQMVEKEALVARLERAKLQEQAEFEITLKRQQVESEIAHTSLQMQAENDASVARACAELKGVEAKHAHEDAREQQRITAALSAGLSPEQYCRLSIARTHFETMASSKGTKYLAVPPNLLGMMPLVDSSCPTNAPGHTEPWTVAS
eukprot:TRINITY_DN1205_c0_g1_i3.p1 TRINITY_DN1205_c0_g1~~TRINITY_DN1205_c0_g1_i3.p1  ORF type:complete len:390 (-),score=107.95 TRINITY_DN1205_c0_g1_i3:588-1757(-)